MVGSLELHIAVFNFVAMFTAVFQIISTQLSSVRRNQQGIIYWQLKRFSV